MVDETPTEMTDEIRFMFGAGFAFGVTCTMLLMAVVLATVGGQDLSIGDPIVLNTGAGVLFAGVIGASLYLLAFPKNRFALPIATEAAGSEENGEHDENGESDGDDA